MNHAGNLVFMLCLHREAVSSVPHGNHGVLKVGTAGVEHRVQLGVDPVVDHLHLAAHLAKARACVVAHLILGENTALDLRIDGGERL